MHRGAAPPPSPPLPRQVKLFGWVSLLNDFASEMIYPLLPAFVTGVLGAGPQALGALDGAAEFAASVVKFAAGRVSDRPARRGPLIVLGYAIAVLVRPIIAVTAAAWQVIGLRVVDRIGKGIRTPPRDALMADVTPASLRGRAFGLQRGMDHAGAVLGPLTAWWLLTSGSADVRSVIAWSLAPGMAVLVLAVWAVKGGEGRWRAVEANAGAAPLSPPSTALGPPRDRVFLSPPHARDAHDPTLPAARRLDGGSAAALGGAARGAVVGELRGRSSHGPHRGEPDDVAGMAVLRGDRGRVRGRERRQTGLGAVSRVRHGGRAYREPRARARRAIRGRASGERIREVPRGDRAGGARRWDRAGRGVSGVRRGPGVPRQRGGGARVGTPGPRRTPETPRPARS